MPWLNSAATGELTTILNHSKQTQTSILSQIKFKIKPYFQFRQQHCFLYFHNLDSQAPAMCVCMREREREPKDKDGWLILLSSCHYDCECHQKSTLTIFYLPTFLIKINQTICNTQTPLVPLPTTYLCNCLPSSKYNALK